MPDFAGYTHKWRAVPNTTDANKVSKRNRQPVSCLPCRTRKLKCDRGHPCEACQKRGDEDVCHYGNKSAGAPGAQHQAHSSKAHGGNGRAQDRLRHLEDLVRRMIDPGVLDPASSVSDSDDQDADAARVAVEKDGPLNRQTHGTNYKGSTHWSAILDSIKDLRTELAVPLSPESHIESSISPHDSHVDDDHDCDEDAQRLETALFVSRPPLPLARLLSRYLPPRQEIDRLLSTYFNSQYVPIPFIHTQHFARQYEEFWKDLDGEHTSAMWLSILFSILTMADRIRTAMSTEFRSGIDRHAQRYSAPNSQENSHQSTPDNEGGNAIVPVREPVQPNYQTSVGFLAASAQLLMIGNYTKPQPFLVEALMIHSQAKYSLSLDPNRETTLVLSLLVRQAYAMSYHRDCSNFPNGQFTVFEAEMRRRTWAAIKQFDLMSSFQHGIPMNVAEASWDTKPPRNLLDLDFDENTKLLPEARGEAEPTPMLYFVFKTKLMEVYAKILRHTLSFPPTDGSGTTDNTKNAVMDLDAEIRRVGESVPTVMRVRPMSSSYSDPSWLIMLRTNLMFVVQKSLCVLHRKYMTSNNDSSFGDATYSRRVVIEAASNMVNHFLEIHNEFQPGGQLSRDWWMLGGFTVNDFLLANMLLCFAFWTRREKGTSRGQGISRAEKQQWLETDSVASGILELLKRAKSVCQVYGRTSQESKKVAGVLQTILDKFLPEQAQSPLPTESSQGNHVHVSGGTAAESLPQASSQVRSNGHDRLDLTPLSLRDVDASHLTTAPAKVGTHQTTSHVPDHEHASAAWNLYPAVPYKKSNQEWPEQAVPRRRPQQQQRRRQLQTAHSSVSDPALMSLETQPPPPQVSETHNTTSSWNGAITKVDAVGNQSGVEQPVIEMSPEQTLGGVSDPDAEPIDMDWATFDQFLGNFSSSGNFTFSTTSGLTPGPWTTNGHYRIEQVAPVVPDNTTMVDASPSSDPYVGTEGQ